MFTLYCCRNMLEKNLDKTNMTNINWVYPTMAVCIEYTCLQVSSRSNHHRTDPTPHSSTGTHPRLTDCGHGTSYSLGSGL